VDVSYKIVSNKTVGYILFSKLFRDYYIFKRAQCLLFLGAPDMPVLPSAVVPHPAVSIFVPAGSSSPVFGRHITLTCRLKFTFRDNFTRVRSLSYLVSATVNDNFNK